MICLQQTMKMETIGVKDILLEYHKITGNYSEYDVQQVTEFPDEARDIRSIAIYNTYIQFCEYRIAQENRSVILWKQDDSE